jgi:hypothetical protein
MGYSERVMAFQADFRRLYPDTNPWLDESRSNFLSPLAGGFDELLLRFAE